MHQKCSKNILTETAIFDLGWKSFEGPKLLTCINFSFLIDEIWIIKYLLLNIKIDLFFYAVFCWYVNFTKHYL